MKREEKWGSKRGKIGKVEKGRVGKGKEGCREQMS